MYEKGEGGIELPVGVMVMNEVINHFVKPVQDRANTLSDALMAKRISERMRNACLEEVRRMNTNKDII